MGKFTSLKDVGDIRGRNDIVLKELGDAGIGSLSVAGFEDTDGIGSAEFKNLAEVNFIGVLGKAKRYPERFYIANCHCFSQSESYQVHFIRYNNYWAAKFLNVPNAWKSVLDFGIDYSTKFSRFKIITSGDLKLIADCVKDSLGSAGISEF